MAAGNRRNRTKAHYCIKTRCSSILLLCMAALLSACQPFPESVLSDYQARLQRVLPAVKLAETLTKEPLQSLPDVHTLTLPIPGATIDLTDMLALDVCDLETLIAERNSSLGKVQTDAGQLHYELRLLHKLGLCLSSPALHQELDTELLSKLQQIYQLKQQHIPDVFSNLLSRDATLRQQLAGSQRGVAADQGGHAETLQALHQLNKLRQLILQGDYQAASKIDISHALGALHQTQLLADLQHSLRLSLQFFLQLNAVLAKLSQSELCQADRNIRDNLLTQIFIGRVQAELARLDGMASELGAALLQLYQQHPMQRTVQQRLQAPQLLLQQQLRQHVAFWQRWRQCEQRG
jgi:hypothetical protein